MLFPKNCHRKSTVSETALAHLHTKIRQVPPTPRRHTRSSLKVLSRCHSKRLMGMALASVILLV